MQRKLSPSNHWNSFLDNLYKFQNNKRTILKRKSHSFWLFRFRCLKIERVTRDSFLSSHLQYSVNSRLSLLKVNSYQSSKVALSVWIDRLKTCCCNLVLNWWYCLLTHVLDEQMDDAEMVNNAEKEKIACSECFLWSWYTPPTDMESVFWNVINIADFVYNSVHLTFHVVLCEFGTHSVPGTVPITSWDCLVFL